MGGGNYSYNSRITRSIADGYHSKSRDELFSKNIHKDMNPLNVFMREARDSAEHPESKPIIIGLDVTGSMLNVPHELLKDGLPTIMKDILDSGVTHPQVLFMAIGDHYADRYPLQIGQFESSDELMDRWLMSTYLEGGGGGNGGESYMLAWYFAAKHTALDSFEKRKQKGILITIGDEPCLPAIDKTSLTTIVGGEQKDWLKADLLHEAQAMYHVYHIHITCTGTGREERSYAGWKEMLGENCIIVNSVTDIAKTITRIILSCQQFSPIDEPVKPTKGIIL